MGNFLNVRYPSVLFKIMNAACIIDINLAYYYGNMFRSNMSVGRPKTLQKYNKFIAPTRT